MKPSAAEALDRLAKAGRYPADDTVQGWAKWSEGVEESRKALLDALYRSARAIR